MSKSEISNIFLWKLVRQLSLSDLGILILIFSCTIKIMITAMPRHMIERIRFVLISGIISFLVAFFIDQYYIAGKGWWFLLELVQ